VFVRALCDTAFPRLQDPGFGVEWMDAGRLFGGEDVNDDVVVSGEFVRSLQQCAKLSVVVQSHLHKSAVHTIMTRVLEAFTKGLGRGPLWDEVDGKPVIGWGGLQRLVLDLRFLLVTAEVFCTDATNRNIGAVIERGIAVVKASRDDIDEASLLKPDEWFDSRIQAIFNDERFAIVWAHE
jgi:hypothetical protein